MNPSENKPRLGSIQLPPCPEHKLPQVEIFADLDSKKTWLCRRCKESLSETELTKCYPTLEIFSQEFSNSIESTLDKRHEELQDLRNKEFYKGSTIDKINLYFSDLKHQIQNVLDSTQKQLLHTIKSTYEELNSSFHYNYFPGLKKSLQDIHSKFVDLGFQADPLDIKSYIFLYEDSLKTFDEKKDKIKNMKDLPRKDLFLQRIETVCQKIKTNQLNKNDFLNVNLHEFKHSHSQNYSNVSSPSPYGPRFGLSPQSSRESGNLILHPNTVDSPATRKTFNFISPSPVDSPKMSHHQSAPNQRSTFSAQVTQLIKADSQPLPSPGTNAKQSHESPIRNVETYDTQTLHIPQPVSYLEYSPQLKKIICGGQYGLLWIYDIETQKITHSTVAHENSITSILFIPTFNNFITGGDDNYMKVFRIDTKGKLTIVSFVRLTSPLVMIIHMENIQMMAAISEKMTKIRLWKLDESNLLSKRSIKLSDEPPEKKCIFYVSSSNLIGIALKFSIKLFSAKDDHSLVYTIVSQEQLVGVTYWNTYNIIDCLVYSAGEFVHRYWDSNGVKLEQSDENYDKKYRELGNELALKICKDRLIRFFRKGTVMEKVYSYDKKVSNKEVNYIRGVCDTMGFGFFADEEKMIVLADGQKKLTLINMNPNSNKSWNHHKSM